MTSLNCDSIYHQCMEHIYQQVLLSLPHLKNSHGKQTNSYYQVHVATDEADFQDNYKRCYVMHNHNLNTFLSFSRLYA